MNQNKTEKPFSPQASLFKKGRPWYVMALERLHLNRIFVIVVIHTLNVPLTVPRLSSGSQFIRQLVCSLQTFVTGYHQIYSWYVFWVVGVVVVDFLAEDKCVPAHWVSPNFSSSSFFIKPMYSFRNTNQLTRKAV